jgi:hypothetical protein
LEKAIVISNQADCKIQPLHREPEGYRHIEGGGFGGGELGAEVGISPEGDSQVSNVRRKLGGRHRAEREDGVLAERVAGLEAEREDERGSLLISIKRSSNSISTSTV